MRALWVWEYSHCYPAIFWVLWGFSDICVTWGHKCETHICLLWLVMILEGFGSSGISRKAFINQGAGESPFVWGPEEGTDRVGAHWDNAEAAYIGSVLTMNTFWYAKEAYYRRYIAGYATIHNAGQLMVLIMRYIYLGICKGICQGIYHGVYCRAYHGIHPDIYHMIHCGTYHWIHIQV